ncbi:MAG: hypothetical protein LKF87_03830 [Clostridium tyrobutyricum]|jgi:hypothetical protein|uniref:hypothetical protein n=1 Tax=Clostridium tyrobutyricum TaxID=1519 RepID=UPI00242E75CF|nr:hypothetical protein [Clostridium tyrobutyricum]MCH4199267.1 hypothetical protein [Clostridium tyrobutyricum]MCH4236599.1 hypothetical protein [Clostridium tyrobutyricum]MCH4258085.1 hypothetical protein [Clostridium tyrobutyricum]MCI1239124.1 hypothetical protein [Clostridium tyrobutyricum]MCI1651404.1 hypothetical protein [Clostridium tyrobutyricum]
MFLYKPIGEMTDEVYGEMDSLSASISQVKPSDIPLAQGVDLNLMKSMDKDPLEVAVEIPATKSKRGWNYKPESLKNIVDYVNTNTLNGFLGHQKAEDVSTQFVPPVTSWIGAKMNGNKAYFRGLIDADAAQLKRWVRTGRIKEVSIFGFPKLKKNSGTGEMDVTGYNPLSIDWTPLHRPGMPTSIVGMEMDSTIKNNDNKGGKTMDFKELMQNLKGLLQTGTVTYKQVFGELGVTTELVAGEMEDIKQAVSAKDTLDKVKGALEVTGEMDIVDVAKKAHEAVVNAEKAGFQKVVDDVVKEKVTGEMAQNLVKKMLKVESGAAKEVISGEIDNILKDEFVKNLISQEHLDIPTGTSISGSPAGGNAGSGVSVRKSRI